MAFLLAFLSFIVGMALPFLGSVAYVLYVSVALAAGCLLFGVIIPADGLTLFIAWLASIVALQAGFAVSVMGLASWQRSKSSRQRSTPSANAQTSKRSPADLDAQHLSSNR